MNYNEKVITNFLSQSQNNIFQFRQAQIFYVY